MRKTIIGRNKVEVSTYFFKKEKTDEYISSLPANYGVKETPNGLPVVKKI